MYYMFFTIYEYLYINDLIIDSLSIIFKTKRGLFFNYYKTINHCMVFNRIFMYFVGILLVTVNIILQDVCQL